MGSMKEESPNVRFDLKGEKWILLCSIQFVQEVETLIFGLFLIPGNCVVDFSLRHSEEADGYYYLCLAITSS